MVAVPPPKKSNETQKKPRLVDRSSQPGHLEDVKKSVESVYCFVAKSAVRSMEADGVRLIACGRAVWEGGVVCVPSFQRCCFLSGLLDNRAK